MALTALGDFAVAHCRSNLVLNAASNSTGLLADHIEFGGPGLCNRVRHCADGETGLRYPWQGNKLEGPFSPTVDAKFDICLNTPIGRARGMLYLRLTRRGDGWVAATHDYPIGESSVRLSGRWTVSPDGFRMGPWQP